MSVREELAIRMHSDSLADNVQSFPQILQQEIPLYSSENVYLHIAAQCSATCEEIPIKGTLKLVHKAREIRVQWFPSEISNKDLTCLYSHDPSDDWEDLVQDLNGSDMPNLNGENATRPDNSSAIPIKHHNSTPEVVHSKEMKLPSANGDPFTTLRVKTETLRPTIRTPSKQISPGFVNIEATPLYCNGRTSYGHSDMHSLENSPSTSPHTSQKSARIFTINNPVLRPDHTLDTAISKLGDYSNLDSDAVFLERDQTQIPEVRSVVVDFPIGILFSVKEVSAKVNGNVKTHPAIRFNLKGSKPTQNLYFHSGKQTMMRFYEELQKHILLDRNDEDPTLLIAESDEFILTNKNRSNSDHRSYLQIASSKATDIISDNLPKLRALMNFPFPRHPSPNISPDKQLNQISSVPKFESEIQDPDPVLEAEITSIPFMDKPNFDLMALLEGVKGKTRGIPLNRGDWELFCDTDGSITDPNTIRSIIFNGGIEEDIRPILWSYLLGYYKYSQTDTEREQYIAEKENEYLIMRSQWKTMSSGQIRRNKNFNKAKSIIAKDTIRTDRDHPYFAGEGNANLDVLQDILLTHIMYDFDLGYIQGMSDILSPILIVLDREIDSFWCFAHYLEKLHDNFADTTQVLRSKMDSLKDLLKFVDPPFCAFLKDNEAYGFNIFFRWLLVDFKREFKFPDLYKLWEVLWTEYLTPNYNLFVALSMLLQMRQKIMEQDMSGSDFTPLDNIFRMVNDAAGEFDIDTTLLLAEALFTKMLNCPNLPSQIRKFFPTYHKTHDKEMCALDMDGEGIETNMELEELYFA